MATYGSTTVNGVLNGNLQFLNLGYGLTGFPDYGGVDGDPINGSALIFLVKLGGLQSPIWLDTDLNKATGYNGYDYHIIWTGGGPPKLYSGSLGQTLVATLTDYVYVGSGSGPDAVLEFAIPSGLVGGATSAFVTMGSSTSYVAMPQSPGVAEGSFGGITLDGSLNDWTQTQRIDSSAPNPAIDVYGAIQGGAMLFALHLNTGDFKSSNYTTLWLDTDFNRATGYAVPISNVSGAPTVQVGAEYNLRFDTAGHVILEKGNSLWPSYSPNGAAVYSETVGPVPYAFSTDYKTVEVAVPLSMLGPNVTGAKVHVESYYSGDGPPLTADGYAVGTPPGGSGGQQQPPVVTIALLHDTGQSNTDGIADDPTLTGTGNAGAVVSFTIDGVASPATATADATGKWTFAPTGLAQGQHTVVASETDAQGNIGTATLGFTYDSVAPSVGIASSGGSIAAAKQTITGTGEPGTQVTLFDGSAQLGASVQVDAGGNWSESVTFSGSGGHTVTARDVDVAGNVGQSAPVLFTLAAQPPVFTGMKLNSNSSVTLTGTADPSTHVTVFDGSASIGTATVNASGRWTFITGSSPTNVTHVFTATASDTAGNASGTSGSAQLGSSKADILTGTSGNDIMTGGKGADLFSFIGSFGNDIITDFAPSGSGHDSISFKGNPVLNSYRAVIQHSTQVGSSVVIRQDANDTITLTNVSKSSLTSSDFTFG